MPAKQLIMGAFDVLRKLKNDVVRERSWKHQVEDARSYFKITGTKPDLTAKELEQIKNVWGPLGWHGKGEWHAWYKHVCGKFDPYYVPSELYATYILPRLQNSNLSRAWDDKSFFDMFFPDELFAHNICRCVDGVFVSEDYSPISSSEAALSIMSYDRVIVKPSLDSSVGRGIEIWKISEIKETDIVKKLENYGKNFVVQELIRQHPFMAAFNDSSVNIIRINSFRTPWGGVQPLNAIIRFGELGSHTDISHAGGIERVNVVGVSLNGKLFDTVYNAQGKKTPVSTFEAKFGAEVPGFLEALDVVSRIHSRGLLHFDIVGFDIAINTDGRPVVIEYNTRFPGITFPQYACGPFFGNMTPEVISYLAKCEQKGLGR